MIDRARGDSMSTAVKNLGGSGNFARGIHPGDRKEFAADAPIEVLPTPAQVVIPLLQHTGAPCSSLVKVRQEVAAGEVIGDTEAFVSAPVHSPVAGVVQMAGKTTLPNGRHVDAIPIKTAEEGNLTGQALLDDVFGGDWPTEGLDQYDAKTISQAVRKAGLVGMGGAAFPTHVKLAVNPAKPIDTLLLNGCECEPYLTADYRVMLECPAPVITGALLAGQALSADRIAIAIEDNKPLAIEALQKAAAGTRVQIVPVHTKYPMGGERQTIPAVTGRVVPTGKLPLDVGVVVMNVGTTAALARAVLRGKPLTHRVITVSGAGIREPRNILAPVGASYQDLIDFCGGLNPDAARVVAGGPMMGFALGDLSAPVTKGTSGVTVLTEADVKAAQETACVRCGRCVDVCPLHLVPSRMALAARNKDWDLAKRYHIRACCECGCCSYICPARIPLAQLIRMGKAQMPRD
jgi:electron transport complex protein RnfC